MANKERVYYLPPIHDLSIHIWLRSPPPSFLFAHESRKTRKKDAWHCPPPTVTISDFKIGRIKYARNSPQIWRFQLWPFFSYNEKRLGGGGSCILKKSATFRKLLTKHAFWVKKKVSKKKLVIFSMEWGILCLAYDMVCLRKTHVSKFANHWETIVRKLSMKQRVKGFEQTFFRVEYSVETFVWSIFTWNAHYFMEYFHDIVLSLLGSVVEKFGDLFILL